MQLQKFKPLTRAEQRRHYTRVLGSAFRAARHRLYEKHEAAIEQSGRIHKKLEGIAPKIAEAEDREANRCDRLFPDWRTNKRKRMMVCRRILDASKVWRERQHELMQHSTELVSGYEKELKQLHKQHEDCLKSA